MQGCHGLKCLLVWEFEKFSYSEVRRFLIGLRSIPRSASVSKTNFMVRNSTTAWSTWKLPFSYLTAVLHRFSDFFNFVCLFQMTDLRNQRNDEEQLRYRSDRFYVSQPVFSLWLGSVSLTCVSHWTKRKSEPEFPIERARNAYIV